VTQLLINAASSTGRCNTSQCVDSTMLARENHLLGSTRSNPSQSSVPAGLTLASDFSFCFQCQAGSSLVLRRPIETTALTGDVPTSEFSMSDCATYESFGPSRQIKVSMLGGA
jgi:hypothetical protein